MNNETNETGREYASTEAYGNDREYANTEAYEINKEYVNGAVDENTNKASEPDTYYTFRAEEEYRNINRQGNPQYSDSAIYGNRLYNEQPNNEQTYSNQSYNEQTYGNQPYGNRTYDNQTCDNRTYSNQVYGNQPYNNQAYSNQPYSDQAYGNQPYNDMYAPYPNTSLKKKGASKAKSFFKKAGIILASAAVFGLVAGATFIGANELYKAFNPETTLQSNGSTSDSDTGNQLILDPVVDTSMKLETTTLAEKVDLSSTDVSAVIESAMPSVVAIESTFNVQSWYGMYESEAGGGSGIIVGKNDTELLIATNNHVIDSAVKIEVILNDGERYEAAVKGRDALADLAVIAIPLDSMKQESREAIRIATLGDSEEVKVGEMAIAIGNALGYGQSATVGYISAKDREVKVDGSTMILLQTDAAINPGNSGGALLNINGEVIGINSIKYASNDVEGMGFAIPISKAMEILDDLMTREIIPDDEKGYLGVYIDDVTSSIATAYNWPIGVYVTSLVEGGAAEKAGIFAGDIITAVNSTTVTTGNMLREKVTSYKYGTTVTITLQRLVQGEFVEKNIDVVLQKNVPETTGE